MVMRFLNCRIAGMHWWLHLVTKSVTLLQKIQLIEFFMIFFRDFFRRGITCARVATHAIIAPHWRSDNFKKSHHHRKQKITRVASALCVTILLIAVILLIIAATRLNEVRLSAHLLQRSVFLLPIILFIQGLQNRVSNRGSFSRAQEPQNFCHGTWSSNPFSTWSLDKNNDSC